MNKRITSWLNGSRFKKNFLRVAKANVFSQIILLACTPVLTRLFSPEDFGVSAVFASLLSITAAVCTWRLDKAVPNSQGFFVASSLIVAGVVFLLFYTLLALWVTWFHPPVIDLWKGVTTLGSLLYFLPAALFFSGLRQLYHGWFVRHSNMDPVSDARIVYTVTYLLSSMVLALAGLTKYGLIAGNVIGLLVCVITLSRSAPDLYVYIRKQSCKRVVVPFRKTLGFTTQASGISFVNMLSLATSVVLLAQVYEPSQLGQYSLMVSLVIVPITTITQALALSFWSRAAELARDRNFASLRRLYHKLLVGLFLLTLPVSLICLLGKLYIVPVLGEQWSTAHEILAALIPMIVGITMFSATNHLIVLKKQRLQIYADALRMLLMAGSITLAAHYDWDFALAVLAMSISSLIGHVTLYLCHMFAYRAIERSL